MPYDAVNAANAPEVDGFAGGFLYGTNQTQYIGYGDFTGICAVSNPNPGHILISPNPGIFSICFNEYNFNRSGYYLLNHPDLLWVDTTVLTMLDVPGVIKQDVNPIWSFLYGRIFYEGRYVVGKLHAGSGVFKMYMRTNTELKEFITGFQVLTCTPRS